jgi:hypothetical protein
VPAIWRRRLVVRDAAPVENGGHLLFVLLAHSCWYRSSDTAVQFCRVAF